MLNARRYGYDEQIIDGGKKSELGNPVKDHFSKNTLGLAMQTDALIDSREQARRSPIES